MIGYFPAPYPDELFYSICARFSDRMQYPKRHTLSQEFFGMKQALAIVDLPTHLEKFINVLPPGHHYTVDTLIDYHTLFPFYRPFLTPSSQQRVRDCMQKDGYNVIHTLIGGTTYHNLYALGCLRFCQSCVEADKQVFGECYWHRVHQLSCVRICPAHHKPLLESEVKTLDKRKECKFISAEKAVQEKYSSISVPEAFYQHFLRIAVDAAFLLDHPQFIYDSDCLKTQYHMVLSSQGLATYGKKIQSEELLRRFNDYYTTDFLQLIHCQTGVNAKNSWLHRATRPSGPKRHPLQHLLLIHFMGYEARTFFSLSTKWRPFGNGPWPCLNPASDHYKQDRVLDCRWYRSKNSRRGKPTGIFPCECGFVYLRQGPDMTPNDRFRLSRVGSYGPAWEATLRHLWDDPTITLDEIARRLQVDPSTAAREASRIELS